MLERDFVKTRYFIHQIKRLYWRESIIRMIWFKYDRLYEAKRCIIKFTNQIVQIDSKARLEQVLSLMLNRCNPFSFAVTISPTTVQSIKSSASSQYKRNPQLIDKRILYNTQIKREYSVGAFVSFVTSPIGCSFIKICAYETSVILLYRLVSQNLTSEDG